MSGEPFSLRLRRVFGGEPQKVAKVEQEERRVAPASRMMDEQVLAEMGVSSMEITNQELLTLASACGLTIQDLSAAERQYRQMYSNEAWEQRLVADLKIRLSETRRG